MPTVSTPAYATFIPEGVSPEELYRQLTTDQAAQFLGVPKRTLEQMRYEGKGPLFVKFSARNVRYRMIDLVRYQERQLRQSSLEAAA